MKKLVVRMLVTCVTFAFGIGCTFAVTHRVSRWLDIASSDYRSCQVKWLGQDGHAVWTPCGFDVVLK